MTLGNAVIGNATIADTAASAKQLDRAVVISSSGSTSTSRVTQKSRDASVNGQPGTYTTTREKQIARSTTVYATATTVVDRQTVKSRSQKVFGDGRVTVDAQFTEVFPSEVTRNLGWDYNVKRKGFESDWVYRESAPQHGTVALYITGTLGTRDPATPTVILDFDRDGTGNVDTRSDPIPIYSTDEPVTFPSMRGESGYYRLLIRDLRPDDIIAAIQFSTSHT